MGEFVKKRRTNVNLRSVHNLCPNCFSRLIQDEAGNLECTGDRLKSWQDEVDKYLKLTVGQQQDYLLALSNPSGFLNLISFDTGKVFCAFNSKISPVVAESNCRIPDPMAVARLERKLARELQENELEEGYEFEGGYRLPFLNFPDDV